MFAPPPQLIFLDAMNTLFTLRHSVGEIYAERAALYDIQVEASKIEASFRKVFKQYHAPVFPQNTPNLYQLEKAWWYRVVHETFQQSLEAADMPSFDECFEDIFGYFASSQPWILYPDVHAALHRWSEAGVVLGIVSNFDSRLIPLLNALGIASYFQSITLSSQAGAAKPDPRIFQVALAKHAPGLQPVLHVGDSWQDDVQGASAAQIQGILLDRTNQTTLPNRIASLQELVWAMD